MEKLSLVYDKQTLLSSIEANAITVPVLLGPYTQKILIAELVLRNIQKACGVTVEEFQKYLNGYQRSRMAERSSTFDDSYERDEFVDKCVSLIEYPGIFKTHGWEEVGNRAYIYLHKLLAK